MVCATLTGVLGRNLDGKNGWFDVVYVDEAAQAHPRSSDLTFGVCCCAAAVAGWH